MVRRTAWLVLAAAVIAVVTLVLIQWSGRWNRPQTNTAHVTGQWTYRSQPVAVSIDCKGPSALVGTQLASYLIHVSLTPASLSHSPMPVPSDPVEAPHQASPQPDATRESSAARTYVWVWFEATNAIAKIHDGSLSWSVGHEEQLPSGIQSALHADITPTGGGPVSLTFFFGVATENQTSPWADMGAGAEWAPDTRPPFVSALLPYLLSLGIFGAVLALFIFVSRRVRQLRERTEKGLGECQRSVAAGAETHLAWETASIKLDEYFNRNLLQVNLVFWVAVLVMTVGFAFVLMGVVLSLRNPKDVTTSALAAASGIITQFIGATFMVIYRSIMQQANGFMSVLERINAAGMAVSELERIPESMTELKSNVRAQFAESLLGGNRSAQAPVPKA